MSKPHTRARMTAVAELIRSGMLPAKNGVNTVVIEDDGRRVFTVVMVRGIALGEDIQTLAAHLRRIRSLETDLLAKGNAIRRLEKKIEHLETELRKREEAKA